MPSGRPSPSQARACPGIERERRSRGQTLLLFGYRHLTVRYERKGSHFLAVLGLAATLTCYKKLTTLTT